MAKSTQSESTPTPQTPSVSTVPSIARFTLPAEGFALTDLFERVPDAHVECESTVANPADHALLVIRTNEREHDVDAALRADANIAAVEYFGKQEDSQTYRVTWKGQPRQLIQRLTTANILLLSAQGRGDQWDLRLQASDREGIARVNDIMNDLGCMAECQNITTLDGGYSNHTELTDGQREALVEAFESGYFDIPQGSTLDEVATEIGVTHQALSERLHRACYRLIKTEFAVTEKNTVEKGDNRYEQTKRRRTG